MLTTILIIAGAVMALLGLGGLGYCIKDALRLRRGGVPADEARGRLQTLVAVNIASVGVAFLGLALVAIGLIL